MTLVLFRLKLCIRISLFSLIVILTISVVISPEIIMFRIVYVHHRLVVVITTSLVISTILVVILNHFVVLIVISTISVVISAK